MAENVLDLSGTAFDDEEYLIVFDKTPEHKRWLIDIDLPGRTLKILFRDTQAWRAGRLDEDQSDRMYESLWHLLRRNQPDCTVEQVRDAFSLRDISKIYDRLFIQLGMATPQEPAQDQEQPAATADPAATAKQITPPEHPPRLTQPRPPRPPKAKRPSTSPPPAAASASASEAAS